MYTDQDAYPFRPAVAHIFLRLDFSYLASHFSRIAKEGLCSCNSRVSLHSRHHTSGNHHGAGSATTKRLSVTNRMRNQMVAARKSSCVAYCARPSKQPHIQTRCFNYGFQLVSKTLPTYVFLNLVRQQWSATVSER